MTCISEREEDHDELEDVAQDVDVLGVAEGHLGDDGRSWTRCKRAGVSKKKR